MRKRGLCDYMERGTTVAELGWEYHIATAIMSVERDVDGLETPARSEWGPRLVEPTEANVHPNRYFAVSLENECNEVGVYKPRISVVAESNVLEMINKRV